MPPDSGDRVFAGLDPVSSHMCATLAGLENEFGETLQIIDEAKAVIADKENLIAAAQGRLDQLRINARKLQDAGLLMGYDLFKLMDLARARSPDPEIGPPAMVAPSAITEPTPEEFRIKDFVLEQVYAAYPGFVTAAEIQSKIKELGHKVHPKTVGMSLYRWSQQHAIRREGKANWIFVPEDQRPGTVANAQEASEQVA